MNSLTKLIASISAPIASLSFAWVALTLTGIIPRQNAITVYHRGSVGFNLSGDFEITHDGSLNMWHDGSVEITH